MRVISLLPSATEILCAIGADDLLVGRSHECDFPAHIADRPVLTGQRTTLTSSADIDRQVREQLETGDSLYTLDQDAIQDLRPDVILTQDLCEVCSIDLRTVQRLASTLQPIPRVVSLNPRSLEGVFDDILSVGEAIGLSKEAAACVVRLRERFYAARDHVNAYVTGPEVAFLEWLDPMFVGGHWTPQLIEMAGARHSLNAPGAKSPTISPQQLVEAQPQHIIIAPCGVDLGWIRRELGVLTETEWWPRLPGVRDGRVALVDGHWYFNMPGPRLVDAFEWLVGWLHDRPELVPTGFVWEPLG